MSNNNNYFPLFDASLMVEEMKTKGVDIYLVTTEGKMFFTGEGKVITDLHPVTGERLDIE
jgi:hypothetical protein